MYFLSLPDPDYRITSARDPLGFQVIWQSLGRTIVAHLSTVSRNLVDFRVMALAHYFHREEDPRDFIDFFIRWEQVCAYAREVKDKDSSYNGKNFVSKKVRTSEKNTFEISNSPECTILSNQKAYGIYGKYNRPFSDMALLEHPDFETVFNKKMDATENKTLPLIRRILKKEKLKVKETELNSVFDLISTMHIDEKKLYEECILQAKTKENHEQNVLYKVFNSLKPDTDMHLYFLIDKIKQNEKTTKSLQNKIDRIKEAEKILTIYTTIFKHLQTRTRWKMKDLLREKIMKKIPVFPDLGKNYFQDELLDKMGKLLQSTNKENLIKHIIDRNKKVAKQRENAAWIEINEDIITVLHRDGARAYDEWDLEKYYNNSYFLSTYSRLFEQIKTT